jgi:hypothetical protein
MLAAPTAAEASEAAGGVTTTVAGAVVDGAGVAGTTVSSFLLHAAKAIAVTTDIDNSAFLILVSSLQKNGHT